MRRSIVSVVATLLAFVAGIGVNKLIWATSDTNPRPVPQIKAVANGATVAQPVVPVITPVETLQEGKIILDYNHETFAPEGDYGVIGQMPREFAEFDGIAIGYFEENVGAGLGDISVITKSGESYQTVPAIFGFVTERRVVFLTSPDLKTEFEYRFDGEFIRRDSHPENDTPMLLKGTLTKTKGGQKVAERLIKLRLEHHGC